jgi:hypothetical protein
MQATYYAPHSSLWRMPRAKDLMCLTANRSEMKVPMSVKRIAEHHTVTKGKTKVRSLPHEHVQKARPGELPEPATGSYSPVTAWICV